MVLRSVPQIGGAVRQVIAAGVAQGMRVHVVQAAEGARGRERQAKKLLAETMLDNAILKDINA
jgi:hypothetical protein